MLTLNWVKCQDGSWPSLFRDDLHTVYAEGVYVIWHAGLGRNTVYVGQGQVSDRLRSHQRNPEILQHANPDLKVTWAAVDTIYRDGVERFLADVLAPKVGEAHPTAFPVEVNLPKA